MILHSQDQLTPMHFSPACSIGAAQQKMPQVGPHHDGKSSYEMTARTSQKGRKDVADVHEAQHFTIRSHWRRQDAAFRQDLQCMQDANLGYIVDDAAIGTSWEALARPKPRTAAAGVHDTRVAVVPGLHDVPNHRCRKVMEPGETPATKIPPGAPAPLCCAAAR